MRNCWKLASAVVCLLAPLPLFAIAVTSTANAGPGTLRQAILDAELTVGSDTITFAVNPADLPITLSTTLPTITHPIVIDGTSQPGYAGVPIIEINGNGITGNGLFINAGASTVKALIIRNFNGVGIQLVTNGGNTITNCYIGTNAAGTAASANTSDGLQILSSANNVIGGDSTKRNVISGNGSNGIYVNSASSSNSIQGNYIGTNATGAAAIPNSSYGIRIIGASNTIGGFGGTLGNLISGNSNAGIGIDPSGSGTLILGNLIGTNAGGTAALPNQNGGIQIGAPSVTVGGLLFGTSNVISGNQGIGVSVSGAGVTSGSIQGNSIGTNAAGTAALGNTSDGVRLDGTSNFVVGGSAGAARNILSGNGANGVAIGSGTANVVLGNTIGLNAAGTAAVPNAGGVTVSGTTNTRIGDSAAGVGNIISGNTFTGIVLNGNATGTTIEANLIGTNAAGTAAMANGAGGIILLASSNTRIGGTAAAARNLISGNASNGIAIDSSASTVLVEGNWIGVNAAGTAAVPNAGGVSVGGTGQKVGDAVAGAGNVISGNTNGGIVLQGSNNFVYGNLIGTNPGGTAAIANGGIGIRVYSGTGNAIGSSVAAGRNVISGNTSNGITIDNVASATSIQGNYIGINAAGTAALPNAGGVSAGNSSNVIGGILGSGNVISGNTGPGVVLDGSSNIVQGNFIGTNPAGTAAIGNGGIGIRVYSGTSNQVGGTIVAARNIISGNGSSGVSIDNAATSTNVQGNYIGLNAAGTAKIANAGGVSVGTSGNTIGGTSAGARNVISGNTSTGVALAGTNNTVQANYIGTNAAGSAALGNGGDGIRVLPGSGHLIGGTSPGMRNVLSGNTSNGISIDGGVSGVTIQGNYIGTDATGLSALANAGGITISGNGNTVGGVVPGSGNVIAANTFNNIALFGAQAFNNTVQGNVIGMNLTGTAKLGTTGIGIRIITSNGNTIGGTTAAARNSISGALRGITLEFGSTGNVIQGNYIGTNAAGTAAIPNGESGIAVGAPDNTIGGAVAGAGNVVSGQTNGYGIWVQGATSHGTKIYGNIIGTRPDGTTALPNLFGVVLSGTFNTEVGGISAGMGNTIRANSFEGVHVQHGYANPILGNSITGNTGALGIDLAPTGVGVNDPQDSDTGPNLQQNYPLLSSVVAGGGNTTIQGTLNSTPNTVFRIEYFGNSACDPSGMGEGGTFLGALQVATDGGGNAPVNTVLPVGAPGTFVTATATGPASGTSEFSPCALVGGPNPGVFNVGLTTIVATEVDGSVPVVVTRSQGMQGTVTVHYTTANGTATEPSDYTLTAGTLTFLDGEVTKLVNIPVFLDGSPEPQQTFTFTISSPGGGATLGAQTVATIYLDDVSPSFPAVSITDVSITEGDAGTKLATFTINVSPHSALTTIGWNTSDGTAKSPSDYTEASGFVEFPVGENSKTVDIVIQGDTIPEQDEDFFVVVNSIQPNGFVTKSLGEGIIVNDDGAPEFPGQAAALSADSSPNGGLSDGNGVFEPGETAKVFPAWTNNGTIPLPLTGAASTFTGPPGATYTINDSTTDYGQIATGATSDCSLATGNCLELFVSNPGSRPATHWDATFSETLSNGQPAKTWKLHLGSSFTDVPKNHVFYRYVERLLHSGVTVGCTATTYCPDDFVFRLQMSVFIARAQAGGNANVPVSGTAQGDPYNCVGGGISLFTDVPASDPFCRHVHYILKTGVTTGCQPVPPRQFCPADDVTRGQMALFIGRAVAGSDAAVPMTYGPDAVTGRSYSCAPGNPDLFFSDITTSDIFCRHVHFLWAKDVISGFPDGTFGPGLFVTRGAMAKFLSNGLKMTAYGP